MKIRLLFFFTFLLLGQVGIAQTPGFVYSSIRRPVENKQDSLLLIRNEQTMWVEARKENVLMFDNPMLDCEFKVKMSKAAIHASFQDTLATKSGASFYMMNLMQNRNADTCFLMSFSPFLIYQYQERKWVQDSTTSTKPNTTATGAQSYLLWKHGHWETGEWRTGTSVRFLMPLSSYKTIVPAKEMKAADVVYRKQFAAQLGGKVIADTIYRTVHFTVDSNEYLPQAPYANLLVTLKNFTFSGELRPYKTNALSEPMSKAYLESQYVAWDSTNRVEDPYNPGVFILAPLKREGQVKSLLICEKWVPCATQLGDGKWIPQPYMGFRRIVTAYGLQLDSGNTIWFSPADMQRALDQSKFNMIPYEECFRAERFKTLQVQLRTW